MAPHSSSSTSSSKMSARRTLLLVLAFLDTVCTRVGNSHGHNQGKQAAMSFPITPILIYFHVKAAAVPSSEQIFLDIPFGAYVYQSIAQLNEIEGFVNTDQSKQTVGHVTVTSRTEPRWYVSMTQY